MLAENISQIIPLSLTLYNFTLTRCNVGLHGSDEKQILPANETFMTSIPLDHPVLHAKYIHLDPLGPRKLCIRIMSEEE